MNAKKAKVQICPNCHKKNSNGEIGAQCLEHLNAGLTPQKRAKLLTRISEKVGSEWVKLADVSHFIEKHPEYCSKSQWKLGFGGDTPIGEKRYLENGGGFVPVKYYNNERYVPKCYCTIAGLKAIAMKTPMKGTMETTQIIAARNLIATMLLEIANEMEVGK
jgi:methylphosphotriester-DNA--protein-cysteine methyltransferase